MDRSINSPLNIWLSNSNTPNTTALKFAAYNELMSQKSNTVLSINGCQPSDEIILPIGKIDYLSSSVLNEIQLRNVKITDNDLMFDTNFETQATKTYNNPVSQA